MARIEYPKVSKEATQALYGLDKIVGGLELDRSLKDLIRIRVSQLNHCAFCLDMHSKEAKIHGERELRLYHLPIWRESVLFNEKEKAGLEWAELLTKIEPHGVSDEDFENMRKQFSEKEISDLTFVILTINAWNRLGVAFRALPGSADKIFGLEKAGLS